MALNMFPIDGGLLELVGDESARQNFILPIEKKGETIRVAMADPMDYVAIDDIELMTGFKVQPVISSKSDIVESIEKISKRSDDVGLSDTTETSDGAPAGQFV